MKKAQKNNRKNQLDLYDEFLAHTGIDRLQKIIARYELFKKVMDVPGDIVECGVNKGSGIYTLAKLLKIFAPNNEKKIVGFDFFKTSRNIKLTRDEDKKVLDEHVGSRVSRDIILNNLLRMGISNVELIPGDVIETTKIYSEKNLGFRISLLYLDVDNYEGTLSVLKNLFPLVVPGGIIIFDEYAYRRYGESDAVDVYFKGSKIKIKSLGWANTPTAYIVKERI